MENVWPMLEGMSPGAKIIVFLILTVGTIAQRYLALLSKKADMANHSNEALLRGQDEIRLDVLKVSERVDALEVRRKRTPRASRVKPSGDPAAVVDVVDPDGLVGPEDPFQRPEADRRPSE